MIVAEGSCSEPFRSKGVNDGVTTFNSLLSAVVANNMEYF